MYDYIIATSSTSDLPRTYLEAHNIPFIPYTYTIGNDLYEDDCREETRQKVYEGMRNGDRLKTSMINEYIYDEFFESLLAQGKDVIFLDMSQKMSVSYEKSKIGAKMALEKYPERKLYVMDTLCISGGLGLLVDSMVTGRGRRRLRRGHRMGRGEQAEDRAPLHRGRSELPQGRRTRVERGGACRRYAGDKACAVRPRCRHAGRCEEGSRAQDRGQFHP